MAPKYLAFRRWWRTPLAHHLTFGEPGSLGRKSRSKILFPAPECGSIQNGPSCEDSMVLIGWSLAKFAETSALCKSSIYLGLKTSCWRFRIPAKQLIWQISHEIHETYYLQSFIWYLNAQPDFWSILHTQKCSCKIERIMFFCQAAMGLA